MYCPHCGTRCGETARFCGNCGTRLPETAPRSASVPPEPCSGETLKSDGRKSPLAEGVILTNIPALAAHFDAGRGQLSGWSQQITRLLQEYARQSQEHGIHYHLIDTGNYRFLNPEAGRNHVVSLTPASSWEEHSAILADYYRFGRAAQADSTNYLFIVGGHDIIPMPVVPHYVTCRSDNDDQDIETDIPYAYLLGRRTQERFASGELFTYEQYFHVGRLPLSTDVSWNTFQSYFDRSLSVAGRIPVNNYFGVANKEWADLSVSVCKPLREFGLPSAAERFHGSTAGGAAIALQGLFLSQPVSDGNLEQVFDDSAGLYYFNLHGSNVPTSPQFFGDTTAAVCPHHMARAARPNCLVTEACYGARFIGYSRQESMLLAAIYNQTLLYLGSSRIAVCRFGAVDYSDLLTTCFITALLSGYTAGEALFLGRQSFFLKESRDRETDEIRLTTIAEFNLFGDPYLSFDVKRSPSLVENSGKSCILTTRKAHTVSQSKCLDDHTPSGTLLGQVRTLVNTSLAKIREKVDREVYDRLGVEPRQLRFIDQHRFDDGSSFYTFTYRGPRTGLADIHIAVADTGGNIKTIVSSK